MVVKFLAGVLIVGLLVIAGYYGYAAVCPAGQTDTPSPTVTAAPPATPYEPGCEILVEREEREGTRWVVVKYEGHLYRMLVADNRS